MECEPAEKCVICGSSGTLLYTDLKDHLFGAAGSWNIRRCVDQRCGLLWLDPVPLKSELWKAYSSYYTHRDAPTEGPSRNPFKRWAYYFYDATVRLTPVGRQRRELQYMFLRRTKPGRLLDIGCGDGSRLALFRDAGWTVEGVEMDEEAAKWASDKHGLTVRQGELHDLQYGSNQFDAVIMNHVLEHVYEPQELVAECFRLLKPGGTFVAVTPNAESLGHRTFRTDWRGLEPPRHLHLFNRRNLLRLVNDIPATQKEVWTSVANAEWICGWSLRMSRERLKKGRLPRIPRMIVIPALQYGAAFMCLFDRSSGEECVLRLTK